MILGNSTIIRQLLKLFNVVSLKIEAIIKSKGQGNCLEATRRFDRGCAIVRELHKWVLMCVGGACGDQEISSSIALQEPSVFRGRVCHSLELGHVSQARKPVSFQ